MNRNRVVVVDDEDDDDDDVAAAIPRVTWNPPFDLYQCVGPTR